MGQTVKFSDLVYSNLYIGLNKSTWLKSPQPPEMTAWVSQDVGASVSPLTEDEWKQLLENVGLDQIASSINHVDVKNESRSIIQRYGCGGILGSMLQALRLYFQNPNYRQFVKRVNKRGITPKNLEEFFGYGIYIGRKKK